MDVDQEPKGQTTPTCTLFDDGYTTTMNRGASSLDRPVGVYTGNVYTPVYTESQETCHTNANTSQQTPQPMRTYLEAIRDAELAGAAAVAAAEAKASAAATNDEAEATEAEAAEAATAAAAKNNCKPCYNGRSSGRCKSRNNDNNGRDKGSNCCRNGKGKHRGSNGIGSQWDRVARGNKTQLQQPHCTTNGGRTPLPNRRWCGKSWGRHNGTGPTSPAL
jgi:hypothetical protein